ncbi:MAG: LPS export ABC transporter periplasmic protein LptC [Humidesulfovibrio sp.]|uniref:LPS export ABC transporter periplasmic protein LptC n=1 Tax=Humidesulfovibrio sp. TaxID=2910988 RepID=UPI0027F32FD1|nr:LPS export ABC transporter periplasmic protein LptC [Humidesulfovibrio sp.]MDQ7834515.1 LPS export ABC transporter periplasmic protein LptC [Humidesulfovibrio sp.]
MRKSLVYVVLIFVFGLAIGLVVNEQRNGRNAAPDKPVAKAPEPDVMAEDLELVQGADGKVLWRVRAKSAQYRMDQRIVQVLGPQLTAYVGADRQEVFIKSDTGEVNQQGNTMTLRDNITGRFGEFVLTSDVLDYIGAMKKIYLKGQVSVSRPDFSVNATTVEINLDTRELTAAGGVTAELLPAALDSLKKEKKN